MQLLRQLGPLTPVNDEALVFFWAKFVQALSGCFGKSQYTYAVLGAFSEIFISTQRTLDFSQKLAVQLHGCI